MSTDTQALTNRELAVKADLTVPAKRTKHQVETTEYLAAARRFIRGAGRRCVDGDEVELGELIGLQETLKESIQTAVDGIRERGMSWEYIASATGTSRVAAYQKWGKK